MGEKIGCFTDGVSPARQHIHEPFGYLGKSNQIQVPFGAMSLRWANMVMQGTAKRPLGLGQRKEEDSQGGAYRGRKTKPNG